MSGDDVTSSNKPDAQKMMPAGAGIAGPRTDEPATDGRGDASEINWVGQQHLMGGYCGRTATSAGKGSPAVAANPARLAGPETIRPVALHQRPRDMVVRIGPKPPAETAGVRAKAA